ncbi:imelysin family protein [Flavobacterium psychrophilum]|uniref:Imelysin family protein n=1 Tax=Flavobacterium psychrophilum TaxID=96345 RepID=A0A7U2NEK1_FLAPS|nr:imelysin family protein [Flavobacterium psychrophilum]EKT4499388.1 imelysin family protein [Flavobacterium psychrophilum]EKT4552219.1 imelysin family protein [Flavobacterium psychrophilum]ELM3643563.1 imelysin family protein [Flavobacterium psychrophilum]ELM3650426.1 imelysin family protein [Flavobacterium psychrophilum]ELM3671605.1 imelysin family protein [Flavobacterium psychrophilum]
MKKVVLILSLATFLFSCSKNEEETVKTENAYDRTALLTNWANNIIVPSYVNYQEKVQLLVTNINNFNTTPTVSNLETVRASWLESYKAYQYISIYNFGKAEEIYIKESSNTYPTNRIGIEANITSGSYNLEHLSQFDKQGFPALDYLLNGLHTNDATIVGFYTTNTNATNYKSYLLAVANRLKTNADAIVTSWNSGFKTSYIANNGTSVSSSINKTANNFVKNLEKDIRTGKLGIPAGVFSSGVKYPEKTEAYYKNNISKILLNEAVKASQDFFNGKHFNSTTTGEGFRSYLDFLNVVRNGQKLSTIINNQFTPIYAANNALNDSFSQQVTNDNAKMLAAYDALQQNVVYTKLDMMQALNIAIDYVDGDGD